MATEPDYKNKFSKFSIVSNEQMIERERWGQSQNGYIAGGNFEDNPNLKRFTI